MTLSRLKISLLSLLAVGFFLLPADSVFAAGRVFYDGFEDGTTDAWGDGGGSGYYARCDVVTSAPDGGSGPKVGMRMASCNWDGAQGSPYGHQHQGLSKAVPEATEYLYRFWTRADLDVDVANGSKLGRLQGEGCSFFDYLFAEGSSPGNFYYFATECNTGDISAVNGYGSTGWPKTQWRKWEIYIKDDDTNGIFRVWVNDELQKETTNVDTSSASYSWGVFYAMSNWSISQSGWEHDANNHVYWDEFEIYTSNGFGGSGLMSDGTMSQGGGDTTPPAAPTGLGVN